MDKFVICVVELSSGQKSGQLSVSHLFLPLDVFTVQASTSDFSGKFKSSNFAGHQSCISLLKWSLKQTSEDDTWYCSLAELEGEAF